MAKIWNQRFFSYEEAEGKQFEFVCASCERDLKIQWRKPWWWLCCIEHPSHRGIKFRKE